MKKLRRRIKKITATVLAVLMIGTAVDVSALATVAAEEILDFSEAQVLTEENGSLYIDGVERLYLIPAGNYKLGENITTNKKFITNASVNLDLNGYTWNMSDTYLELQGSATVSLYDTSAEQTGKLTASVIQTIELLDTGTTFNLYSGTVENTSSYETAQGVDSYRGSCNLYGGKIKSSAYAVYYDLGEDSIINLDGTVLECGEGHGQFFTELRASATPQAVIDVSDYTGTSLAVDAEISEAGRIKIFQGIQSAQDAERYTVNVSSGTNYDFFLEKEEYDREAGETYVYVSAPSFTQQPTKENGYEVSFNHPDATLQWYEYNVLESNTYSQITEWELIASYEVKAGDELFLSAGSDDFWLSLEVGEESLILNGDTKTANISFASDTTVEVQVISHRDNVSELKLEHIRYTEIAGKTGTDLQDSECGTTYICKATVGDKVYYSDTVKREHNCKYSANGAVISGLCTECGSIIGTVTISAEGGIYNGTAVTANVTNTIDDVNYSTAIVYKDSTGDVVDEAVNAGTYTANLTLTNADGTEVTASCGFEITKETAVVEVPTSTAITYGQTLSEATLSSGWSWVDGTTVPTVTNNGYAAVKTVSDYENVDYSALGNGFTYDETAHTLTYTVAVTVSRANAPILPRGSKAYVYNHSFEGERVSVTGLPADCGDVTYSLLGVSGTMLENILVNASSGEITYDIKALDSYTEDLQATISVNVIMENYETAIYALDITRTEKISQIINAENLLLTYGDAGKKIVAETNGDGALCYAVVTGGDVLSVATDGTVTIYKAGSATVKITAAATDAYGAAETTIAVTVDKAENAPNLPYATMNVSYDTETVGAATLPNGWAWEATDASNVLIVGEAVNAIAVYKGADAGNYEIETVEVAITRSACSHSDTEIRDASEASCTADGYTGDTYCKDCGECVSAGQGISAPGHDYKSEVTTEATTTSEGVRTYTCENCSDSYTESIPKLPAPTSTPIPVPGPTASPDPTPTVAPTSTPTPVPSPTATPSPMPTVTPVQEEDGKKPEEEVPEVKEPVLVKGYTVQIGAFSSEANAEKWEQKGEAIDLPMFIIKEGKYYKVQTDVYETREEAVEVAKIFSAAGLDNFILKTERFVTPGEEEIPETPEKPTTPALPAETDKKKIEALAKEVIDGKWGNGKERKDRLTKAGYDYREVQNKVNELLQ